MLIIANPPYGNASKLCRAVTNTCVSFIEEEDQYIFLQPVTGFKQVIPNISKPDYRFLGTEVADRCFNVPTVKLLSVQRLLKSPKETFADLKDLYKASLSPIMKTYLEAVTEYNKTRCSLQASQDFIDFAGKWSTKSLRCRKLWKENEHLIKPEVMFYIPFWVSSCGFSAEMSFPFIFNIANYQVPYRLQWGSYLEFETKESKRAFAELVYYSDFANKLIYIWRDCQSYSNYSDTPKVFPNLDYSKFDTEEKILKEIGLPENHLKDTKPLHKHLIKTKEVEEWHKEAIKWAEQDARSRKIKQSFEQD